MADFYWVRSVCNDLYLFPEGSRLTLQTFPKQGVDFGFYVRLIGTNYTMKGVGNPGHAYAMEFGSPLVADVPAFSTEPGTPVQLYQQNGGANQLWTFIPSNQLVIWNAFSGLVMDVPAFSKQPGTQVQQWTPKTQNAANQEWIFENVGTTQITVTQTSLTSSDVTVSLHFSGANLGANIPYTVWFLNVPGPDYLSTAVPFFGDPVHSDANGNLSVSGSRQFEFSSQQIPGEALCLLEDAQGYVTAIGSCPQPWFYPQS